MQELTAEQVKKNRAVAVAARQRVHGVSAREAAMPEAGSAIGRLYLEGALSSVRSQAANMMEAAEYFHERRAAADAAVLSRRLTTATDYTGTRRGGNGGEGDDPAYVDWCNTARSKYAELRRAILECGDPLAMSALEMVILEDKTPMGESMIGALRCGLNAVHRILRYERRRGLDTTPKA